MIKYVDKNGTKLNVGDYVYTNKGVQKIWRFNYGYAIFENLYVDPMPCSELEKEDVFS